MGSEWSAIKFENLLSEPIRTGIYKKKEFHGRGAKIVNMGELFGNPRLFDVEMKRVELTGKEIPKSLLNEGDLLFARRSLTAEGAGKCIIVKEINEQTTFESSIIRARPNPKKSDSDYLYYFFASPHGKYLIGSILRQVAVAGITGSDLKQLQIPIPPLRVQKSIAHILGTLDDKIELNRQMNATLESMAQALFKSWFVDFDPVIDNALAAGNPIPEPLHVRAEARKALGDQRKPLPEAIQKQFPNRFVFTDEMGWVPDGWRLNSVYEVASFINGAAFKSSHFDPKNQGLPIVKIAEIKNGISSQTKFTDQVFHEKYLIDNGEILFSWSGNPETSIDTFIWANGNGWLNQHIFKVSVESKIERTFVYYLLKHLKPKFTEIARDKQTTGLGHVTIGDMKKLYVIDPNHKVVNLFAQQTTPILDNWFGNILEINSLSKLRDTLLPKLLSGQLRIPDAEKQLAEAI